MIGYIAPYRYLLLQNDISKAADYIHSRIEDLVSAFNKVDDNEKDIDTAEVT